MARVDQLEEQHRAVLPTPLDVALDPGKRLHQPPQHAAVRPSGAAQERTPSASVSTGERCIRNCARPLRKMCGMAGFRHAAACAGPSAVEHGDALYDERGSPS